MKHTVLGKQSQQLVEQVLRKHQKAMPYGTVPLRDGHNQNAKVKICKKYINQRKSTVKIFSKQNELKTHFWCLLAFRKYSIFLHDKYRRAVNLTRAIQCGMICFLFPNIKQSSKNKRDRRENNRTILTKHMSDLANLLPVTSSVVIDRTKSSL